MLLVHQTLDLGGLGLLGGDAGHDGLIDDGIGSQGGLVGLHEALLQLDKAKHVAGLHQQKELLLGHDLAKVAVTVVDITDLVAPGLGHGGQLIGGLVADVHLVGPVAEGLVEGADVLGQLLEVLAVGVHDPLGSLGGSVMKNHIGGVHQNVSGAFDNTFHTVHSLSRIVFPGTAVRRPVNRYKSMQQFSCCGG